MDISEYQKRGRNSDYKNEKMERNSTRTILEKQKTVPKNTLKRMRKEAAFLHRASGQKLYTEKQMITFIYRAFWEGYKAKNIV